MSPPLGRPVPSDILAGLDDAQREAVTAVSGPVAIAAGAGTGKTTVVSRRAAYAVATGATDERRALLVTFTEKAAREMAERVRALGLARMPARTFHSAALAQLRHFWPPRHDGEPLPEVLSDPWRLVAPLTRDLPGGYRFTPTKDLVDEIAWAKARRIRPEAYPRAATPGRTPPIPVELFVGVYRGYERAKARRGVIDFDDILSGLVDLLEADPDAAAAVQARYAWFSVDEFQDTTPLQYRLLELWLGERRDLCVVGDEDQTIYSFAGGSPAHLREFAARFPGARVIPLLENYRSSPQVLGLANRLLAAAGRDKRLAATRPAGPEPTLHAYPDDAAELAAIVERTRKLIAGGTPPGEIGVLVRLNAQVAPIEAAFMRAGVSYEVRGQRFFERRDVRSAIDELRRLPADLRGAALVEAAVARWQERLGYEPEADARGAEARERLAAMAALLGIVREVATPGEGSEGADRETVALPGPDVADGADTSPVADGTDGAHGPGRDPVVAELERRAAREQAGSGGVQLLTLHRAKGLEWDAVFLPALEEGLLPVAQSVDDAEALEEERRLLYVGITRARLHLALSWALQRPSATGRPGRRTMSRFLRPLLGRAGRASQAGAGPVGAAVPGAARSLVGRSGALEDPQGTGAEGPMSGEVAARFEALRAWRLERARRDGVPPYVIFHDATLRAVATARPTSEPELLTVAGIGPAKLEKYGPELIDVVTRT